MMERAELSENEGPGVWAANWRTRPLASALGGISVSGAVGLAGVRIAGPSTHCVGTRGVSGMRTGGPHSGNASDPVLKFSEIWLTLRGRRA